MKIEVWLFTHSKSIFIYNIKNKYKVLIWAWRLFTWYQLSIELILSLHVPFVKNGKRLKDYEKKTHENL